MYRMNFEKPSIEKEPDGVKPESVKEKPAAKPEAKKWTPEEEAEIQKIRAKRYGERMANREMDREVDAMLSQKGLKPFTPEAEKFMNKKDWEWAEKEFAERKEGEKMFDRMLEVMSAFMGISKEEIKNIKDLGEVAVEIGKEKKITKDNLAEIVLGALEKVPPDSKWAKFKEGESGKRFKDLIKDIAEVVKIDDDAERKNKLEKLREKYGAEAEIMKEMGELIGGVRQLAKIAEKGEGGQKEEQQLKETQGKFGGFLDKVWATFGFMGAIGLILLIMTYLTLMAQTEKMLNIKKGGR